MDYIGINQKKIDLNKQKKIFKVHPCPNNFNHQIYASDLPVHFINIHFY